VHVGSWCAFRNTYWTKPRNSTRMGIVRLGPRGWALSLWLGRALARGGKDVAGRARRAELTLVHCRYLVFRRGAATSLSVQEYLRDTRLLLFAGGQLLDSNRPLRPSSRLRPMEFGQQGARGNRWSRSAVQYAGASAANEVCQPVSSSVPFSGLRLSECKPEIDS
jgi:hypothetical protein